MGVKEAEIAAIPAQLAKVMAQTTTLKVFTSADLKGLLSIEATRELLGCDEDTACLAKLGQQANADLLLSSAVGRVGTTYIVTLTLVDLKRSSVQHRASKTVASAEMLLESLSDIVAPFFGRQEAGPSFSLPAHRKLSFAVFDMTQSGIAQETVRTLTQVLSAEIKKVEGAQVISRDDLFAMLQFEQQKQLLGCSDDISCLAEIGGALGVDKLIVGNVGKLNDTYVISLNLIDAQKAQVDHRVVETFVGLEDQLIQAIRMAGRQLLGIATSEPGQLLVTANQSAVDLLVDDAPLGSLPLPPQGAANGRHRVRLEKKGFYPWQSDIYLSPNETTPVWAEMKAMPTQWYQEWWVWTIAGSVVVGATVGTVMWVKSRRDPGNTVTTAWEYPAGW